jgi:ferredoxin
VSEVNEEPRGKRTNAAKVRRAAADLRRPGAQCKAQPNTFLPIVDHGKCEAKGDCIEVCPYDVFEVAEIAQEDYRGLCCKFVARTA